MAKSRFMTLLFIFLLGLSLVLAVQASDGRDLKNERAPGSGTIVPGAVENKAMGDELTRVDAEATTGHVALLGVEYVNGHYWVTSAGETGSGDTNYLFELDGAGNIVSAFLQPTVSTWGWRDLAYDGFFLYASDSGVIEQISMIDGQPTGVTIPSPEDPGRALAYDPLTDHFWVGNFESDIYEIDRTGAIINQYANSLSIYGLGWDPFGGYLWAWSQDSVVKDIECMATQIDPATGIPTGTSFEHYLGGGEANDVAGGASITGLFTEFPGKLCLVTMHQADSDTIVVYDIGLAGDTIYLVIDDYTLDDICPAKADGDGIVDPGENVEILLTVGNIGTLQAENVTAAIASVSPWVTIVEGATTFPYINGGESASNNPPNLEFKVDVNTPCGTVLDIEVTLSGNADKASWVYIIPVVVGDPTPVVLLHEEFETWPPAGWTIVTDPSSVHGWDSAWAAPNQDNGDLGTGDCASADVDSWGTSGATMDTSLISPVFSLVGLTEAPIFEYVYKYNWYTSCTNYFDVDITTDGATWTNLKHYDYDVTDPTLEIIDLSAYIGEATVQVRFHYYAECWAWYAMVDNVNVGHPQCVMEPCEPSGVCGNVLLLSPDDPADYTLLTDTLALYPDITVTIWDWGVKADPTVADLEPYCPVIVGNDDLWDDNDAIGDVLADYVDGGGKVIQSMWLGSWSVGGRFWNAGYSPFTQSGGISFHADTMDISAPDHPIMKGVTTITDHYLFGQDAPGLNTGADLLATWPYYGDNAVAVNPSVVGINMVLFAWADWTGDVGTFLHNSILWLCCPFLGISDVGFTDYCQYDPLKAGGDGVIDPGEEIEVTITTLNSGSQTATGIVGALAYIGGNPGVVTIINGTTTFPDLNPAQSAANNGPPFSFFVETDAYCGELLLFEVTYTCAQGAITTDTFELMVGAYAKTKATILEEYFESWPPAGWTIIDNEGFGGVWKTNVDYGRTNYAGSSGMCADADSDDFGTSMDTELLTPSFSLSGYGTATLEFIAAYNYCGGDWFEVDISVDGGASWTNLLHWASDHDAYGPGELVKIGLFDYLGQADCIVRFHYYANSCDWYAEIDDVKVTGELGSPVSFVDEHFESWPLAGWTIKDNGIVGGEWKSNDDWGRTNYAGGDGMCAAADSDKFGNYGMDTELWTPSFDLSGIIAASLEFITSYNHYTGSWFDVDISIDGGLSWTNLLHWAVDHDAYGPGETVNIDLAAYLGQADCIVRFYYFADNWDYYAQVDDVNIRGATPPVCEMDVCCEILCDAWYEPEFPVTGQTVNFYSDVVTDCPGALTYDWDFGDLGTSTDANPTHVYTQEGTYYYSVLVSNGDKECLYEGSIYVELDCFVWIWAIFADPLPAYAQEPVTFSALVENTCPGGLTYEWEFGDGNMSFEEMPTHIYENEGWYLVWLTVTTEDGHFDSWGGWLLVGPPMDLFIFDDEGRADVEVTTSTGRYRVIVHVDGWHAVYEGFGYFGPCPFPEEYDDIAEWFCLYSGPLDPWFFKMGMDLTHHIYLGHFILGDSFVEIYHHP